MLTNDNYGYDHSEVVTIPGLSLTDPAIKKIERIRYLKSGPTLEFSYCIAVLADGTRSNLTLDTQFSTMRSLKGDLLAEFKSAGRYAKGLGVFDGSTISIY